MSNGKDIISSLFSKRETQICPICNSIMHLEKLNNLALKKLENGLSLELRQNYRPHESFGVVMPILYSVFVCTKCYYAAFKEDLHPKNNDVKILLEEDQQNRVKLVNRLFNDISFSTRRNIEHGFLSYLLGIVCYAKKEDENKIYGFKKALCALRGAWLAKDIAKYYQNDIFALIYSILFKKAAVYYSIAFTYFQSNKSTIERTRFVGPDINKDFGYAGVIYLTGYLNYRLSNYDKNEERKKRTLDNVIKIMRLVIERRDSDELLIKNAREILEAATNILSRG